MRSFSLIVSVSLLLIACGEGKKEAVSGRVPESRTSLSQLGNIDSSNVVYPDSTDENGKPVPIVPIEEMTRDQLNEYEKVMTEKGFYMCCIEPSCRMCLFEFEACICQHDVQNDEPICGQCFKGWQYGKGRVRGVHAEEVKRRSE